MNINTLEFIHKLLQDEAARTEQVYRNARRLQYDYESHDEPDAELCKHQKMAADDFCKLAIKASNALLDFEDQEW